MSNNVELTLSQDEIKSYLDSKEKRKKYYQENKERINERYKERYATDEEFRKKQREKRLKHYYAKEKKQDVKLSLEKEKLKE